MTTTGPEVPEAPPRPAPGTEQPSDLETLRGLLFSKEIELLESLRRRLDDPAVHAREVGDVIADAILLRAGKDERLSKALEPAVESILKSSLLKNPLDFAGALFPLMGPAIRRSIAETFRSMLESLSKSVEMSFSWKGLRWRLEAMRSGKSFSEVILLHTLVYRVEQAFFIHAETGLVLAHAVGDGVNTQDADMVSAMLTAIQDFVRDCFSGGESDLDTLHFGPLTVYVEKGPSAYLACVVRGAPPADFRASMQSSLEIMLLECADALAGFDGDTSPFPAVQRRLEDCLISRFVDEGKPLPLWVKILPVLFLICLAGGYGWWRHTAEQRREARAVAPLITETDFSLFRADMLRGVELLRREPGLVVIGAAEDRRKPWHLLLLRDELARDPREVLAENNFDPEDFFVREVPYISYEPQLVLRRVGARLHPPAGVRMDLEDGVLHLTGSAPLEWILKARREAIALPGVHGVNSRDLIDPRQAEMRRLVDEVEGARVRFPLGGDQPIPEDRPVLDAAVDKLVGLEKMAAGMGVNVSVTIYGHADTSGTARRNYEISRSRAVTLAALLYAKGSGMPVSLYGMGADYANRKQDDAKKAEGDRRVELKVHLTRSAEAFHEVLP